MSEEPEVTKKISNTVICNWFYYYFIFNGIIFGLTILVLFMAFTSKTLHKTYLAGKAAYYIVILSVGLINTLFFYLICKRSLLA